MNQTPLEQISTLRIGTVDSVSPDRIEVSIDISAPESIALNTGIPRPFPRVNDYLLIPVDESFITGQVEWLTVERSAFPKRSGMRDFGLVDLPYPLRKLRLNPLGTLRMRRESEDFVFRRGADVLPTVGEHLSGEGNRAPDPANIQPAPSNSGVRRRESSQDWYESNWVKSLDVV